MFKLWDKRRSHFFCNERRPIKAFEEIISHEFPDVPVDSGLRGFVKKLPDRTFYFFILHIDWEFQFLALNNLVDLVNIALLFSKGNVSTKDFKG